MMSVFIVGGVKVVPPSGQLVRLVSLVECWISRKQMMIRLSQEVTHEEPASVAQQLPPASLFSSPGL